MEVVMVKEARFKLLQTLVFATFLVPLCSGAGPEQGIFTQTVTIPKVEKEAAFDVYEGFTKSMYKGSQVGVSVVPANTDDCHENDDATFTVTWMIRYSECEVSYTEGNRSEDFSSMIFDSPDGYSFPGETFIYYYKTKVQQTMRCASEDTFGPIATDESDDEWERKPIPTPTTKPLVKEENANANNGDADVNPARRKRDTDDEEDEKDEKDEKETPDNKVTGNKNEDKKIPEDLSEKDKTADKPSAKKTDKPKTTKSQPTKTPHHIVPHPVTKTKMDGRYFFIVKIEAYHVDKAIPLELKVEMKSHQGYLSAFQWPLLPFYGVMCAVYSVLAFVWLLLLGCNWRDLLRIQFWIGGVLVLGLLEKAIFYAEYEHVNKYGESVTGAIIFAELISCLKRSLARMLLIIVSLGYGITRPRLGRDLHWVMAAGSAYFILSSVEGCLRVKGNEQHALIAVLPLAVLDAVVCWWIFKNLVDTTRQLRLRRNLTKLWLYRHLTNTLIVCIVSAVVFLIWSTKAHRWTQCVTKWRELWLDDAYWHVLFCVILSVIMVLVRPTANNQRYAFSPLVDAADDEESQQPMISDAFDSVKMRQMPGDKPSSNKSAAEDALKWVEDNIPAAVADAALGAFDDSEEELVNTLERNKME